MKTLIVLSLLTATGVDLFAAAKVNPTPANPAAAPAAAPAAPAAEPAKPRMAAIIANVEGKAEIRKAGGTEWTLAKEGQELLPGSIARTNKKGKLTILLNDGSKLRLGPNAVFKLEAAEPSKIAAFIGKGRLESWVAKLTGRNFQIRTPVSVASVRGSFIATDVFIPIPIEALIDIINLPDFSFTPSFTSGITVDFVCTQGNMDVTNNTGNVVNVAAGQAVTTTGNANDTTPPVIKTHTQTTPDAPVIKPEILTMLTTLAVNTTPTQTTTTPPATTPAAPKEVGTEDTGDTGDTGGTGDTGTKTDTNLGQETSTVSDSAPK